MAVQTRQVGARLVAVSEVEQSPPAITPSAVVWGTIDDGRFRDAEGAALRDFKDAVGDLSPLHVRSVDEGRCLQQRRSAKE